MYTVVNDIKRTFAVFSAVFLTLITSKVRGHEQCSPEELMECARPLKILDSGLNFVSTKADIYRVCPDLKEAIICVNRYTRFCMTRRDRGHFKKLFHGPEQMVHNLCQNDTYQREYLKHASCMQKTQEDDQCFTNYTKKMQEIQSKTPIENIPEVDLVSYQKRKREAADEGIKSVCCTLQEFIECSTHTMRRQCGDEAAEFSKTFLDEMSSRMIKIHCTNYGPRECGLIYSSSTTIQYSVLGVLVLSLITLLLR